MKYLKSFSHKFSNAHEFYYLISNFIEGFSKFTENLVKKKLTWRVFSNNLW